jgi:NADPH:quinone reductase-like Zn-dependent oxidoreductase
MSARPQLAKLAGDGRIRVFVAATFPLAEAAAAHRMIMTGHTAGKIALIP